MGDRANVYIQEDETHGVFLYTHWGGSELAQTVQSALIRGKGRWNDSPYLARIIFSEMIKDDVLSETSFGISTHMPDNEHAIIVVDCAEQRIGFAPEPVGSESPVVDGGWSFQEYCHLTSAMLEKLWDIDRHGNPHGSYHGV